MVCETTTRPIRKAKTAAVRIAPPAPVFMVQYIRDLCANSLFVSTSTPSSHFPNAAFQGSSKLKSLYTSRSNPNVGIAGVDQPGCCSQKAGQETALKNHEEHGKTHPEYSHREACSIVNDVLPSKFHKNSAINRFEEWTHL